MRRSTILNQILETPKIPGNSEDKIDIVLQALTWVSVAVIIVAIVVSFIYIEFLRKNDKLTSQRRTVEYLPNLVSTLGVLGTFMGITVGLYFFNPGNLNTSIPKLLEGLKTAFFTSLAGMIGSVLISWYLNKHQDKNDGGVSDINQAVGTICLAVQQMSDLTKTTIQDLSKQLKDQETDRKAFYRTMGDIMDSVRKSQSVISENIVTLNSTQNEISSALSSIVILERSHESAMVQFKNHVGIIETKISSIEKSSDFQAKSNQWIMKAFSDVSKDTHHLGELLDVVSGINGTQDKISDQIFKLKDVLDAEVDQIEQSMEKTNELLERKFDEFTELLKKSNTEALVEVMKKVT